MLYRMAVQALPTKWCLLRTQLQVIRQESIFRWTVKGMLYWMTVHPLPTKQCLLRTQLEIIRQESMFKQTVKDMLYWMAVHTLSTKWCPLWTQLQVSRQDYMLRCKWRPCYIWWQCVLSQQNASTSSTQICSIQNPCWDKQWGRIILDGGLIPCTNRSLDLLHTQKYRSSYVHIFPGNNHHCFPVITKENIQDSKLRLKSLHLDLINIGRL